ncbi:hypothetical protein FOA43_003670 [Brettanomyces nanus]|uniref:Uncharacterized protein n=1 Tax=Eeniella nana TaxID=13502 RepID=A0A875SBM8_EENNA|nr:uncharacterized protein FOA43_003670 [Brettanomyces nanus]QPG76284.1 hypothetical protein FOA43_003670 [Brettanomyces nanus]
MPDDLEKYLDPEFDPHDLRVLDLRQLLKEYDVSYTHKAKKAQLVTIFREEVLPKMDAKQKLAKRKTKTNNIERSSRKSTHRSQPRKLHPSPKQQHGSQSPSKESRKRLQQLLESQRSPSKIRQHLEIKNNPLKSVMQKTIPSKRSLKTSGDDEYDGKTSVYEGYSRILKKPTNRKNDFSSSPSASSPRNDTLFPRDKRIKFEKTPEEKDEKTIPTRTKSRSLVTDSKFKPKKLTFEEDDLADITPHRDHSLSDSSRSSVVYRPNVSPSSSSVGYITAINELPEKHISSSPVVPFIPLLPSSTPMHPRTKVVSRKMGSHNDVSTKLLKEARNGEYKVISGPRTILKDVASGDDDSSSLRERIHTPEISSSEEEDETMLKQLQAEFDSETSRVEEESKKVMKSIDHNKHVSFAFNRTVYKLISYLLVVLLSFMAFTVYREERIAVGFCGHSNYRPIFHVDLKAHPLLAEYVNAVEEALKLECIPCPEHGICFDNSELHCKNDYTVQKPWYSLFGLIPCFDKCVLDSEKVAKIDRIVKSACDALAKRNANLRCGTGSNEEVGLSFESLQHYLVEKLALETEVQSGEFEYLWNKSLAILKEKPELAFNNDDTFVRSNSLAKLTIKCKLKRVFVDMLLRLRYWLLGIVAVSAIVGYIYLRISWFQQERKLVKELTSKTLNRLQEQATAYRHEEVKHKYIGKIQLRDYYLSDPSINQKKRLEIWEKVAKVVEKNSNVNAYSLEVNGEIMKAWEWASDI